MVSLHTPEHTSEIVVAAFAAGTKRWVKRQSSKGLEYMLIVGIGWSSWSCSLHPSCSLVLRGASQW